MLMNSVPIVVSISQVDTLLPPDLMMRPADYLISELTKKWACIRTTTSSAVLRQLHSPRVGDFCSQGTTTSTVTSGIRFVRRGPVSDSRIDFVVRLQSRAEKILVAGLVPLVYLLSNIRGIKYLSRLSGSSLHYSLQSSNGDFQPLFNCLWSSE